MKSLPPTAILATIVCCLLTLASGVAHGWLDGRWVNHPDLTKAAQKLNDLPKRMGDWVYIEDRSLSDSAVQLLRCYGYTHRVYQNQASGARVTFAVLHGPRGPIAVHTPEICYSAAGMRVSGGRRKAIVKTESGQHSFWQISFLSKVDAKPALEVHYGWSDGKQWQAADHPRFWLTENLYKLQIAGTPPQANEPSPSQDFLEVMLPHLTPLLNPTQS